MAACDKLYGNKKEWLEFHAFLRSKKKNSWIKKYMFKKPDCEGECTICYITSIQDWLIEYCPLEWVEERLNNK